MFSLLTLLISCFHTFTKHETLFIQLRISLTQSHILQLQERQKIIKQQRHLFAGWTTGTHGLYHWHCSIDYVRQTVLVTAE